MRLWRGGLRLTGLTGAVQSFPGGHLAVIEPTYRRACGGRATPGPPVREAGSAGRGREERDMRTIERTVWTCVNCRHTNAADRKRCTDCGTTRY